MSFAFLPIELHVLKRTRRHEIFRQIRRCDSVKGNTENARNHSF